MEGSLKHVVERKKETKTLQLHFLLLCLQDRRALFQVVIKND